MSETELSLVERIQRLEDEVHQLRAERSILETMNLYSYFFDYGGDEGFLDCFTESGSFALRFPGSDELQAHAGKEKLAEFFSAQSHVPTVFRKHLMLGPRITIEGDEARVRSYWVLIDGDQASGPLVNSFGTYDDRFVKCEDERWRFEERVAEVERFVPIP
jgi:hypothetical protein